MTVAMPSAWRKSSRSGEESCVEVGSWRKSSRCEGGACVEVGHGHAVIGVRDTGDHQAGPVLRFGAASWRAFIAALKAA